MLNKTGAPVSRACLNSANEWRKTIPAVKRSSLAREF
jgi:hypothetical protein